MATTTIIMTINVYYRPIPSRLITKDTEGSRTIFHFTVPLYPAFSRELMEIDSRRRRGGPTDGVTVKSMLGCGFKWKVPRNRDFYISCKVTSRFNKNRMADCFTHSVIKQ